jgi:hypothetical protein
MAGVWLVYGWIMAGGVVCMQGYGWSSIAGVVLEQYGVVWVQYVVVLVEYGHNSPRLEYGCRPGKSKART